LSCHAGDVGHYDEDGHVIIDDRIKELIKVKGLQVGDLTTLSYCWTHLALSALETSVLSLFHEL